MIGGSAFPEVSSPLPVDSCVWGYCDDLLKQIDDSVITDMLRKIERAILANNVFVSGSIAAYDDSWTKEKVDEFCYKLSKRLIKEDYRVTYSLI